VRLLAILCALALGAASCSNGGDAGDEAAPDEAPTGDGAGAAGDPADDVEVSGVERAAPDQVPAEPTGDVRRAAASGPWSDAASWEGGSAPVAGDHVWIDPGFEIVLDTDAKIDGMTLAGSLAFDPAVSVTIGSTANIVVAGNLQMRPGSPSVEHVVEFLGVDEAAFLGGGLEPLEPDVGLWVIDEGQLDIQGSERRGWSTVTGAVEAGASAVEVDDATGWQVGDSVVLSPTAAPSARDDAAATWDGFHQTTIAAIDGTTVTLADPTIQAHPIVDGQYRAELMNLTRNVIIRGTAEGHSHVFIHTHSKPQFVRWALLDRLGVPDALGRYPIHFHHAYESARGSLVEGVVTTNGGNHAFVPHESYGITMRDLVAYNTEAGDVYWWDEGDQTHDLVLDHVIAARMDESGFYLGRGDNMTIRDAVAVGISNREGNVGGYEWENVAVGNWRAEGLVAHNNNNRGIRVWQNSDIPQIVDGFAAYHNTGPGIEHGAYTNRYIYKNAHLYGNWEGGIILQAVSRAEEDSEFLSPEITFENIVIDSAGNAQGPPFLIQGSAIPAAQPVVLRNVTFQGDTTAPQPMIYFDHSSLHQIRCVDCTFPEGARAVQFDEVFEPDDTWVELISDGASQRVRPVESDPGATYVDEMAAWVAEITRPVPAGSGAGTGLTVEYFEDPDLSDPVFSTVLPSPVEIEWTEDGTPYYQIDGSDGAGARWSGEIEIEPGQGGRYTFHTASDGGVKLWVDGELLIDDPDNDALNDIAGRNEASIELEGGGRYGLVIEVADHVGSEYFVYFAYWTRPDGRSEILPTSQLYPAGPIPVNDPEIAPLPS
jgi:hypothetical protein